MNIAYDKNKNTWFHQIDPLSKFVWIIVVAVWLVALRDITSVVLVSGYVFLISSAGARLPLKSYMKAVIILIIGGVWLILFQGLTRSGPGVRYFGVHLSYNGLQLGTAIVLRSFGLAASSLAFSTTTSPADITQAMIKIGVPYRFAHVIYLSLRFLPLYERDAQIIADVHKLRGVTQKRGKLRRTIIALLATQLRRVDEVTIALETRAFGLHPTQTQMKPVRISMSGIVLLLSCTFAIALQVLFK